MGNYHVTRKIRDDEQSKAFMVYMTTLPNSRVTGEKNSNWERIKNIKNYLLKKENFGLF